MKVTLNGRTTELNQGTTVAQVVRSLTEDPAGIAVAIDGEVVARSHWDRHAIDDGQSIEVLRAVQGG